MADHIQIGDVSPRIQYVANGAQAQFTYPFPIFAAADLEVYLDATKQSSGFTVAGAGVTAGGSATFAAAPASGVVVTLRRKIAIKRTSDFQESGEFRAKVINDELDYQTAALQQVAIEAARAVHLSPTDADADMTLPDKADRAGKFLACDADGKIVGAAGAAGVPVSAFAQTLLDDADAATARATLGLTVGTNVLAPNGDGSQLVNLPIDQDLASDIRLNALAIAHLNGDRLNMVNGWADPLKDETDIETAQNVAATFVATGGGYYYPSLGAEATVDSYATGNQDNSAGLYAGANVGAARTFTLASGYQLTKASFYLLKSGIPTGNATFSIYALGGGLPTGAALAGGTLDVSTLTGAYVLREVTFTTPVSLGAGTYVVAIEYGGGDASNQVSVGLDTSAPTHGGNGMNKNPGWINQGTGWCVIFDLKGKSLANMTVVSKAVIAAASAPTVGRGHFQIKDITGGSSVNTDFKGYVSRDNGTTWTQGTLALVATLADATKAYEFNGLNIAAQPSGTAPRFKFTTHNNKQIELHGAVVQWK